jgi:cytochrome c-type biogenesis protein CcmH
MAFVIFAALLTVLMLLIVFWPALRGAGNEKRADEHDFDLTLYKDQLRELDADIERGTIAPGQAEYARAEIGRRLLAAEEAASAEHGAAAKSLTAAGIPVLAGAALFIPLAALIVYTATGSPGMDAQPLAARIEAQRQQMAQQTIQGLEVEELIKRAEAHLSENPNDGRGWDVLAPMYLRMGRPAEAQNAYQRAMVILGETAARQSGLGQANYMLADGNVDDAARIAFERAVALDARDSRARFFLALSSAQRGNVEGAVEGWKTLSGDNRAAPEWRAAADEGLRRYGGDVIAAAPVAPGASAPALDEETVRDVQAMDPEDRQAMISGMIASLDARLREAPDDLPGWQRLIRSYTVLGQKDEAEAAFGRALEAFAGDDEKHAQITEFAAALGISSGEATQ